MKITILSMFPEMFDSFLASPIPKRAIDRKIADVRIVDIKAYAGGSFRHIDDDTYGGGAGAVLRAKPVLDALKGTLADRASARASESHSTAFSIKASDSIASPTHTKDLLRGNIPSHNSTFTGTASSNNTCTSSRRAGMTYNSASFFSASEKKQPGTLVAALTPVGPLYSQETAERYSKLDHLVLICGHYEGMDERIYHHVDERISIGDYILSGGELAAQIVTDSILRLLPGVLRRESTEEESFSKYILLEYPQYTRPADLDGDKVPEVLLSGDHDAIRRWRLKESLRATLRWRPDLLEGMRLSDFSEEEQTLLKEILAEEPDIISW